MYYLVLSDARYRTSDYLEHGYETEHDYQRALRVLLEHFADRKGEALDERHGFLLLRFRDTIDGQHEDAWLPRFLLRPTADPPSRRKPSAVEDILDAAFGFD